MAMTRRQRAAKHADRGYLCVCGKLVFGNGAKAMHFYVSGHREEGYREGHQRISSARYEELHGVHPLDHPLNKKGGSR